MQSNNLRRLYIGNLPSSIRRRDIEELFDRYGEIENIEIKQPNRPTSFAFITFVDRRDAEDAVHYRHGFEYEGLKLKVEFSNDERKLTEVESNHDKKPINRTSGIRTEYRCLVENLPKSCSWQDLKDLMRQAGDIGYSNIIGKGIGIVEFSNRESMDNAVLTLNNTEFKNPFDSTIISVKYADASVNKADDVKWTPEQLHERNNNNLRDSESFKDSRYHAKSRRDTRSRGVPYTRDNTESIGHNNRSPKQLYTPVPHHSSSSNRYTENPTRNYSLNELTNDYMNNKSKQSYRHRSRSR